MNGLDMIEDIKVQVEGHSKPLIGIATISVQDTQKLTIAPYEPNVSKQSIV